MASYTTKQQKAVLECIASFAGRTVSAGEIVEELHRRGEAVGVATVYRQLEKLEQRGSVHKIITDEGAYYQYCPEHEGHDCFLIKCERCGKIAHVDCRQLAPLYQHLEQEHHFAINPRRTMFYGLCEMCREAAE